MRPDPPDLPDPPLAYDLSEDLDGADVQGGSLAGERRPGLQVRDCRLRATDLANLDARSARFKRVAVSGARMTGAVLTDATFEDVVLEDCRADLAAFGGSTFTRVRLSGTVLAQADLQGVRLASVVLEDCDLTGADLSGARFEAVELRRCTLAGIRGADALRGVRMTWADVLENAAVFAAACGVQVSDAEA